MIVTSKITMDLANCCEIPTVSAMRDDCYSRNVELTLLQNGQAWQIPEQAQAIVSYSKADGTVGQYDSLPDQSDAWTVSGNLLTVALAPQVLTVTGLVMVTVQLIADKQLLSIFEFRINVRKNLASEITQSEEFASEDYLNVRLSGKLDRSGWTPNAYLGTDEAGNVVEKWSGAGLPAVTEADDGKVLRVSGGEWTAQILEYAEEVEY